MSLGGGDRRFGGGYLRAPPLYETLELCDVILRTNRVRCALNMDSLIYSTRRVFLERAVVERVYKFDEKSYCNKHIYICSRLFRNLSNLQIVQCFLGIHRKSANLQIGCTLAVLELLLFRYYLLICRSTAFEYKQLIGLESAILHCFNWFHKDISLQNCINKRRMCFAHD